MQNKGHIGKNGNKYLIFKRGIKKLLFKNYNQANILSKVISLWLYWWSLKRPIVLEDLRFLKPFWKSSLISSPPWASW